MLAYFLVLNRLGDRLTDHHENWYIHLHGEGSLRGFTVIVILAGLFRNFYF